MAGLLPAFADPPSVPPIIRRLAPGVYAAIGDTGRGSEGRPNAGFVVTDSGIVVMDALASPQQGRALLESIRRISPEPIRYLVLTHHHPDHHFGAVEFRRQGAKVVAHPDRRVLASEAGEDALVADWSRVVGLDAMRGFEFANQPDIAVRSEDTLRMGGQTLIIRHPGNAHTAGDLLVWLPRERVLFAGDVLVEDGVTMVVDGGSEALLTALAAIDSLEPRIIVPGHGAIPEPPGELVDRTRSYISNLRLEMRAALERGLPLGRALKSLPPADQTRPVSLNSRRRRNAVRVYLEEEKAYMGLDSQ